MNREDIRQMTYSAVYDRGRRLEASGSVWEFRMEQDGNYTDLFATVRGSRGDYYDVEISIDEREDRVESTSCDCPAHSLYDVPCKHCVAVLLTYLRKQMLTREEERYAAGRAESLNRLKQMQKGIVRHTSAPVKELLTARGNARSISMIQEEPVGRVRLEPFFSLGRDGASVEFKIGTDRMYVLKDVMEFAEYMKKGAYVTYGKQLAFSHVEDNFTEDSLPYLRFIMNWVRNHEEAQLPYYYYAYSHPKHRVLSLDRTEVEEFLDATENREFPGTVMQYSQIMWHVETEPRKRALAICGKEDGVELKLEISPTVRTQKEYITFQAGSIWRTPARCLAKVEDFLECLERQNSLIAFIEQEDVPSFCQNLLPELKEAFDCTFEAFDETSYRLADVVNKVYLDREENGMVTIKGVAEYGEKKYLLYDKTDLAIRNIVKEQKLKRVIDRYTNAYDDKRKLMVLDEDDDLLSELLTRGTRELAAVAEVYVSERFKNMKVVSAPKITVGVSLSGDLMKLELTAGDLDRAELADLLSRYQKKKKFYRLRNGNLVNLENSGMEELAELRNGLSLSDQQVKKQEIAIPRFRALYLDAQLKESRHLSVRQNESLCRLVSDMKEWDEKQFPVPGELSGILREYQKAGFSWIKSLCRNGFGGILADDMGLGKTLQVIAFLLSEYRPEEKRAGAKGEQRKTLIITPASLVYNWQNEFARFAPSLSVRVIAGSAKEREELIREPGSEEIWITSYDLLKRDIDRYAETEFFCEVIDEAQFIKNHGTQASRAVKKITAQFRLALTGTPIENHLGELWSIFEYLMPGYLYSQRRFREELERPIVKDQDPQAMERLKKMIAPFILRRLKRDVLKDLPQKTEESVIVRLSGEQQKLYDAHVKRIQILLADKTDEEFRQSKIQILAELTKLRQICCDPALAFEGYKGESAKLSACIQLILNAISGQHKVLLFSQFTSMLERIEERLKAEGITYYSLTGATSKEKRQKLVVDFQTDETNVFCISLKAGGTGLNLTAADIVIHYDPWWNVAAQNQATDRAHRIGQENPVTVYQLIAKGTIEENIKRLQERKKQLADDVLSGGAAVSREELLELLQL